MLLSAVGMIWLKVGPFLRSLSPELGHISETNFHRDAVAALRRGDAEAAAAAIARDIGAGRDLLLATARFDDVDKSDRGPVKAESL
jgi:DNA-binding GntR family transcriptional regulator